MREGGHVELQRDARFCRGRIGNGPSQNQPAKWPHRDFAGYKAAREISLKIQSIR